MTRAGRSSSAFLAALRLQQSGIEVGILLRPQCAMQTHSNDFASEASGHLLPLLRRARMRPRPYGPQKTARQHDDRSDFGIDARLGILRLREQCEVGLVLAPECIAGRTPRTQEFEQPYPAELGVFHRKVRQVIGEPVHADMLYGL